MRTRVKICGIRRAEDAQVAAEAGADAIGLVFYPDSVRAITVDHAESICAGLPPFVSRVALFLDADAAEVGAVVESLAPDMLQFHGRETAAFCGGFGLPYLRAVPMQDETDLAHYAEQFTDAAGLLLDSHRAGEAGGTGRTFDWDRAGRVDGKPIVVAGGLDADNVGAAIRNMRPYGVDVSGGVESEPGVKDPARIRAFIEAVNRVDCE